MVMARVNDFLNLVIIILLAVVGLPLGYWGIWFLLKEYYLVILAALFIFSLVDLFILGPRRDRDARDHGPERLKKLRRK